MNALLLLLLDSRSPAGTHGHSGGMEAAVTAGLVRDADDVRDFCRGRLRTAGRVAAGFAAEAARLSRHAAGAAAWQDLDDELTARTPSEAARSASRALGRGLLRLVRASVAEFDLPIPRPHHPLVLGAAVEAAGGTPDLAARAAALGSCTAPASAAVRLLGLDPYAVHAVLASLSPEIDAVTGTGLPADSAPFLDLLADVHLTREVRLFAS